MEKSVPAGPLLSTREDESRCPVPPDSERLSGFQDYATGARRVPPHFSLLSGACRPSLARSFTVNLAIAWDVVRSVSYTHLRAHETRHDLVCRLLLEKK